MIAKNEDISQVGQKMRFKFSLLLISILLFAAPLTVENAQAQSCSGTPNANTVCAAPSSGSPGFPSFRSLVNADLPNWTNTRLAKTAAYAAVSADCGSTIALGGSAFYTLTVNAASGYTSSCILVIANEDNGLNSTTARGKTIAISGYSSFILWPGQVFTIINQNNFWQFNPPGRWINTAVETLFVNHSTGSDSNDCLVAAAACATIQNAVSLIENHTDCAGNNPQISIAAETFTENVAIRGLTCPGNFAFGIVGQGAGSTTWQCGAGTSCLTTRDYGIAIVNNLTFQAAGGGTNATALNAQNLSDIDWQSGVTFGSFPSGVHIAISGNSTANFVGGGSYTVSGNMSAHWQVVGNATLSVQGGINVPNALTFGNWLVGEGPGFTLLGTLTCTGTGCGAGSTGTKYNMSLNAVAVLNGTTLPGATAGATGSGAQVLP